MSKWYDKHLKDNPTKISPDKLCWNNIIGQLHRLDGPAVIWSNGNEQWYRNGKCHREDGPALIYFHEKRSVELWCINDIDISFDVADWSKEHDYPNWKQWDDSIKLHFKLTFVG